MRRVVVCLVLGAMLAGAAPVAAFGDGIHAIGQDIAPGTYRAPGGDGCYWARLSGLGGTLDEIIANGNPDGPVTVTISRTDAGFETQGCGEWMVPIVAPSPSAASTTDDMLDAIAVYAEGMAGLYDGPARAARLAPAIDAIAADLDQALARMRPDPCHLPAYLELAGKVGALRLWAAVLRADRDAGMAVYRDDGLAQWFFPVAEMGCP